MGLPPDFINVLSNITGPKGIISGADMAPFLEEWRGRWQGAAPFVIAPKTTKEAAAILKQCHTHNVAVVPQGGNTGLVGGQIPNGEILITMKRLRQIRDVSPLSNALTVEAGVTLADAQDAATHAERLFPLSIGSEGTCQIGGIISTNAGGVNVIRYGNTRDLVLGIEAVLPNGDIWHGLNSLRKDNTGYDLKQLFIGAEGTLGLITAATLRLFPRPQEQCTVMATLPSPDAAVALLARAQDASGGMVSSFELMNKTTLDLVIKNVAGQRLPFTAPAPWYVLIEFSAGRAAPLREMTEVMLAHAAEQGLIDDAVIAENEAQSKAFWALRHNASAGMKPEGPCVKCDVSVPIHQIPSFLEAANKVVLKREAAARIVAFGHLGDGNIHYDILSTINDDGATSETIEKNLSVYEQDIHDVVMAHGGSISAEHGIGISKRDELNARKSPVEMTMMRAIKTALDPKGLMNPGKVLQR